MTCAVHTLLLWAVKSTMSTFPGGASSAGPSSSHEPNPERAAAIRERVYASFIKGGMSPADAQHFVDTMPQQLLRGDDAEEDEDMEEEEGEPDNAESDDSCADGDGPRVSVACFTLLDTSGSKLFTYQDASEKSGGADERGHSTTVHIADEDDAPSLSLSWDGVIKCELLLRGTASCEGISSGEMQISLNGEVPIVASELDGGPLDRACLQAERLNIVLSGEWTDSDARLALQPLFAPSATSGPAGVNTQAALQALFAPR